MKEKKYNFLIGVGKAFKNLAVVFAPALFAFMANVPIEYTPIASFFVYLLKNYIEFNKKG